MAGFFLSPQRFLYRALSGSYIKGERGEYKFESS